MGRVSLWLILGFVGLEMLYVRMLHLAHLQRFAGIFLVHFGLAFLLYLGVVRSVSWFSTRSKPVNRWFLLGSLIGATVFRLTLVGLPPTLSDDIYRYVWDGKVQLAGINPYRYAPNDEALVWLRDDTWQLINHKDIHTIYPPFMQLAFRLGAWLSPTVLMQKLLFLLCDFAIMGLLVWLLPRLSQNPLMSILYAWHPLVVVEVASSGHSDPLGILWLLVGLALWVSHRTVAGTIAFALSFLSKFTTALLLPFFVLRTQRLLGLFLAVVLLGYIPVLGTPHLVPGIGYYSGSWEFNSSLYSVLQLALGTPLLARTFCGVILMVAGGVLASRIDDLPRYTLRMVQVALLLAPVLEPWYLLWLTPLLCLRLSWAWLFFSGLVMLSYMVLVRFGQDGLWQLPTWVKWVEYGPLYAWLIMRAWRRKVSNW